jgi:NAD(P)-dependent dehydrogenase (short-subunit alcohol dehydrogenase family)
MSISEEAWDKTFDANCKSAFLLTQKVAPIMAKTGLVSWLSFNL